VKLARKTLLALFVRNALKNLIIQDIKSGLKEMSVDAVIVEILMHGQRMDSVKTIEDMIKPVLQF
jgi:hypothetical protein